MEKGFQAEFPEGGRLAEGERRASIAIVEIFEDEREVSFWRAFTEGGGAFVWFFWGEKERGASSAGERGPAAGKRGFVQREGKLLERVIWRE